MAGEFTGKVIMVTGAAGNLGRAVVARFAREDARLVLVDRDQARLDQLAAETNVDSLPAAVELTQPAAVAELIKRAEERFGHIDILAHTVGGYEAGKPVHEADSAVFERMLALNFWPVVITCGAVAKHMLEHGVAGAIVVVLARAALKGSKDHSAYTASKAAAQRIVESMAAELRDHGINVNGVLPSTIDTPANREAMPNADFSKWVKPADVANAIAFLASPAARAIHGVSLEVYNRA
jgi:NAD(P)-dependent dehydrogenase (short-subunit alcohol dehydrogenase family)